MTTAEFELREPELTREAVLVLEDPHFNRDTVAIVTGAASGIGRATNGLTVVGADVDESGLSETDDFADDSERPANLFRCRRISPRTMTLANRFTFGFSRHSKHLNGGDMLWDGGYTETYE